jgi:hypothetical protein
MNPIDPTFLASGDVLLFRRRGPFNWLIEHATNSCVSHTEVVVGDDQTAACRNGVGVDLYPLDLAGLAVVLRPKTPFDVTAAVAYQRSVLKQRYDWTGLVRAFAQNKWGRNNTKQWCSENTTLVQRAGGIEPFGEWIPADMVAPGAFLLSAAYHHVWIAADFPLARRVAPTAAPGEAA